MIYQEDYARDLSSMKECLEPLVRASSSQDVAIASCALQALTVLVEGLSHLDPANFTSYELLVTKP